MKKTVNVNIGGMMFHLDDDAFEKLNNYLQTLKTKFGKMEGGDEIIEDIESRIAEIFKERLGNTREVVSVEDVDQMISIMGDPSAYMDDETESTNTSNTEIPPAGKRRLFRDPEKRVLGGVCSGFAAYFNVDPWLIRVIMICLVLFAGVSGFLYFIFWIAMPKAVTTADRIMMKGRKVDINSIEESVKKEWKETRNGLKNVGSNAKSSSFINGVGRFFSVSFGVFSILFSSLILAGFVWCMVSPAATIHINQLHLSMSQAAGLVFDSYSEIVMAYVSAWILIVVPSVLAIYLGIRAILQFKHKLRYVMLSGFLLWLVGWVLGMYTIANVAQKYKMEGTAKENTTLAISDSTTIKLSVLETDQIPGYNLEGLPIENVNLDVVKSISDSLPSIEITRSSNGNDKQSAFDMARSINYYYQLDSNEIVLASYFMLDKKSKFRGQEVDIKLQLPIGYKVFFAKGTDAVIDDIRNLQNVWDADMPGHTFTMTKDGLNCNDCEEDIIHYRDHDDDEDSLDKEGKVRIKVETDDETHEVTVD